MAEKICLIIPVKGVWPELKKCISSILDLDYADYEIIVIDDGLEPSALNRLDEFKSKIKVLKSQSRGPSYARNLAAKNTAAQFLAFTDSDCVVDKNWLRELRRGFSLYPDAAACGGMQKLPTDATQFERNVFLVMKKAGFITDYMKKDCPKQGVMEAKHNPSCTVMYKRDVFLSAGGFLEGLWPGEDIELDYRLKKKGCRLICNPAAVVYHYRPKKLGAFLAMMYSYGKVQGILVRKYGLFRRIHLVPFVVGIILSFIIVPKTAVSLWGGILLLLLFYFNFNFYPMTLGVLSVIFWQGGFLRGFLRRDR